MKRFVVYALFVLLVSPAAAAIPMTRVVAIVDSHTIVVERARVQTTVRLAGVDLPKEVEEAARDFLARELMYRWVLVEPAPNGGAYVYRSPDSFEVNRAVVSTWLSGPSTHVATVLGYVAPVAHSTAAPRVQAKHVKPTARKRK